MFIEKISPSKSDIIDKCLLKYKYKYILGISGDKSPNEDSLNFGSFIHKVFEEGKAAKHIKEVEKLSESFRTNYHISFDMNPKIGKCLENFIRLNHKLGEPIEVELKFELPIAEGILANGVIDRINKGENGGILILDYKTSKREKTKKELIYDKQLRAYAFAGHTLFNVPYSKITCGHYYPLSHNIVTVQFPEMLVEAWRKEEINKVWRIRKKKKDEFPAMENEFCNWCEYKEMCPKFKSQEVVDLRLCEQLKLKEAKKEVIPESSSPQK